MHLVGSTKVLLGMRSSSHLTSGHRPKIPVLTSLRFFAALGIFFLHAENHSLFDQEFLTYFDLSKCVSFFFVLSGFVLYYSYSDRDTPLLKFYISRLKRVWSVTVLSIFFVVLVLPVRLYLPVDYGPLQTTLAFFANLLCVQSFIPIPNFYFGYNAVSWSISVELFFYLIFPFVKQLTIPRFITLISLNILFVYILCALLDASSISAFSSLSFNSFTLEGFVYINPFFRLPEFLLGILSAKIFRSANYPQYSGTLSRFSASLSVGVVFSHFFIVLVLVSYAFSRSSFFPELTFSVEILINQLKAGILFAIAIFLLVIFQNPLLKFLSLKLFLILGQISFSFYLLHQPIMIFASNLEGITILGLQLLSPTLLSVLCWSLIASFIAFFTVERRFFSH